MITKKTNGKTSHRNDVFDLSVIVDFIFEDGLLFISIKNLSDEPAFKVSIVFDKKIIGVNGRKEISSLPLFRNIEFLAPHKEIKIFLDSSQSYFGHKYDSSKMSHAGQPDKISVKISYLNKKGKLITGIIHHNLGIYREIGYIRIVDEKEKTK